MADNNDLAQRRARLTPEQRQRLAQRLQSSNDLMRQKTTIPRRQLDEPALLSYAQQRLWFLWQFNPQSTAYHLSGVLHLTGELDQQALQQSFQTLVTRHESLRTIFRATEDGLPEQVVAPESEFKLTLIDLSDLPVEERIACAQAEATRINTTPFDLTQGPLLRVALIRITPQEHHLVIVMHHIISDAWSTRIIIDEFAACYRARAQGMEPVLPELAIQYADYAAWQHNWLEAGEKERQLAYWRKQLGDDHAALQFPVDHPRSSAGSYHAALHDFVMPPALVARLQRQSQARGATLFMTLLTGFQVLLYRYTGHSDIRVGVAIANRHRVEIENLVGFFVNTQVLRNCMDGRMPLGMILDQTREAALGAQTYQDLPFEQLVEALQPERSLNQNPLFQVMFNYLREDYRALEQLPGLTIEKYELGEHGAQFELTLETLERPDGKIDVRFTYAAELFEAESIKRLGEHYLQVLEQLVEHPDRCVGDITLLSSAEWQQLNDWGVNEKRYADAEPVHRLIERQANDRPDATALIFGDIELSYAQLNERANRLAHQLIALGVRPERRVGIAVERSVEMVVGLLATLKAGGAYVPLDPEYPRERLNHMVSDSAVELLLTQSHVKARIPQAEGGQVLELELDILDLSDWPKSNPDVHLHGEHLAYIIYTSGSTGKPKGVGVAHGPLSMHVQSIGKRYGMTPDDRELQFASINFDGAHERWLVPLAFGAALMPRDNDLWSADRTVAEITKHGITIACFTPGYLQQLAEFTGSSGRNLPIRSYTVGGEAMSRSSFDFVQQTLHPPRIINGYGPTETVITPLIFKAYPDTQFDSGYLPIGSPVGDRTAYVVDAEMNPVPPGVAGELYLGGTGLARGYLNRPGLTAERFVADPFDDNGGRLYRTGDLVRWRADGQVEYLGRLDHQVKIRGFRIELGEIEAQLLLQPQIREAVVVAKDGPSGARLVAYVSCHAGHAVDSAELRTALGKSLPDYMIPTAIVVLESLPLNANGKVDRKQLPEPEFTGADEYEAPQGEVEEMLATIWAETLGIAQVGRNDNFFELGGHSLAILRIQSKLQQNIPVFLPLRSYFEHPILKDIAAIIQNSHASMTAQPLSDSDLIWQQSIIPHRQPDEPVLLSYAQQRHWFLWQFNPQGTAYHLGGVLRLTGELDREALQQSFQTLVTRHESLRTIFRVTEDGLPEQVVAPESEFELAWIDLSDLPVEERIPCAHAEATRINTTPFDLTQGPLLRVALIRITSQEHHLVIVMHHIITDAWSNRIIIDEFAACYRARVQGMEPVLPELPIQYADYAAWQNNWLEAGEKERQLTYWRKQLGDDHAALQFPVDHPRSASGSYRAAHHDFVLPPALVARLQRQSQARGATLFMTLLTGFQVLLYRYTGHSDIRIGVPIANRHRAEIENLVGFFVNTQVLRNCMDGRMSLGAILDQTREAALGAQTYQDLPFEQLVEALQPERSLNQNPLFQVMFNHLREDYHLLERLPGLTIEKDELGEQGAQFELMLDTVERPDGKIDAHFTYAVELFEAASIKRLGEHYLQVLEQLVEYPDRCVGDITLLSSAEWQQLKDWGVNEKRYANAEPVHRLIERQAAERPDATALIFGDTELSYAQLNERANRLAHQLIALGVRPENRVGIAVERSVEMVVGLLATLKAGGAYVPLDPEYPRERLNHMVSDSAVELLLTQSHIRELIPYSATCHVLELDKLDLADWSPGNPHVTLHGEHLAYIIYTSGSTGKPKGAVNRHSALYNRLAWMQEAYPLNAEDTVLQKTPFSFDVSVWEFFWPLMVGARLAVANPGDHRDAARLIALIQQHNVTTLHFVPSMIRAFMADDGVTTCTSLKQMICSGEALQLEMQEAVFEKLPNAQLHNLYGPTEAAIDVTHWTCRKESSHSIPIGQPIAATQTYILDTSLNPVPSGVAGELYLGGAGLARGYLNRSGLTAERFVADPFDDNGGRLYRTGDLVKWSADGQIEYLGRLDHQVKIRGFRIELGEIETQLLLQPQIREAVVVAKDGPGGARLVAYVSCHAGNTVDTSALREALAKPLPDYMIPTAIVVLENLPLNANGKVDRKLLPEAEFVSADHYEAPQGEVEEVLAAIWAEVLGIAQVGRNDNFFELGGHSLAILQVQQKLQQNLSVSLSLRMYFEHLVLKDMAAVIQDTHSIAPKETAELQGMSQLLDLLES